MYSVGSFMCSQFMQNGDMSSKVINLKHYIR